MPFEYREYNEILIPILLANELAEGARVEKNRRENESCEKSNPDEESNIRGSKATKSSKRKKIISDGRDEIIEWGDPLVGCLDPTIEVFSFRDFEKFCKNFESSCSDPDRRLRVGALVRQLIELGNKRKLRTILPNWKLALSSLEEDFPNFWHVIDYLRMSFALAEKGNRVLQTDPILLAGGPGVGKSFFAQRLAEFFGAGFEIFRMENAQANSTLSGSSEFWANARPSKTFESLLLEDYANPTFFLDEVDKVGRDLVYDPLSSLYSLLQPETAENFSDLCYPDLKLNASKITWIMTCNESEKMPRPLLSRVQLFDVQPPTSEQAFLIVNSVIKKLTEELRPASNDISFSEAAIKALCSVSPRKMRQLGRIAIGRCVYAERLIVLEADIGENVVHKTIMGFV